MRRACLALLLAAAAWADGPTAQLPWVPGQLGAVPPRFHPLVAAVPEGVKPPTGIADGRFAVLDLADGARVAVAHEAGGERRGLWVDSDLDGDLAEEGPVRWSSDASPVTTATVRIPVAGAAEPKTFLLMFRRESADADDRLGVITRVHRRGSVEVGLRFRPVALVDGNGDLRFDDAEHDLVYLDLDGDGEIQVEYEGMRVGETIALGKEGYAAEVPQPAGGTVGFRRVPKTPAPRRFLVPPSPPDFRRTGGAPAEPFADFAARFDERKDLAALARYGTPDAFKLLLAVAEKGNAEAVRQMGYAEYVAQEADVARLAKTHPDLAVRRAAVGALHRMDAPGRARVYESILREAKEKDLVEDAAKHLAYFGTTASRAMLLDAFRAQRDDMLRLQIFQGGTAGDPDGPPKPLVDLALEDRSERVRWCALQRCWRMRDPRARSKAVEVLETRGEVMPGLVDEAVRALSIEPDRATMRALLQWAERGSDAGLGLLTRALRNVRDPEVTRAVADGLDDPSVRTRCFCVDLLTWFPDASIVPTLLKAVAKEKHPEASRRMVLAIGLREGVPVDALVKLAGRSDFPARGDLLALLARVGGADPAAVELFAGMLGSKRAEERILALDVAAGTRDASFAPAILACLGHEAWQVRLAAVEALRRVRVREAALPLIELLEREESARVRDAIADTLFGLTGQDLPGAADAWRGWWKDHGETFAVPARPPERKPDEGGTVARFYGLPVRTERVCFVLDRSVSMEALHPGERRSKLDVAREQLGAAAKRLPDRARVNVVLFDTEVESWKKSLVPLTDQNRGALKAFLEKQEPKGMTNLYDALEAALLVDEVDTIFLLSDGAPTAGTYRDAGLILAAVRRLNQTRRIAIHAVAIGHDSDLLRRLCEENGGRYVRK